MKARSRKIQGNILIAIGVILLAAALFIVARNVRDDMQAGSASDQMASEIHANIGDNLTPAYSPGDIDLIDLPPYVKFPGMELPVGQIDGMDCVGILQLPTLDKEFAIISELTMDNLGYAPCRYHGTPYMNNLVIAAHNFYSHFTQIRNLEQGDRVTFIDMDGNVFDYTVEMNGVLDPYEVDKMINSEWDLSLFTCTFDSASRYTVRCMRADSDATVVTLE